MVYTTYDILRKGFKKWYGCFISMQRELLGCEYSGDFNDFGRMFKNLKWTIWTIVNKVDTKKRNRIIKIYT